MPFEVNQIVEGVVKNITKFGAFVDIGGKVGLVHISEVAEGYVKDIADYLKVDDTVKVKVISVKDGKIGLSIRQAQPKKEQSQPKERQPREEYSREQHPREQHPREQYKPRNNQFKKSAPRTHTSTFDDQVSQFLKDSEERQQVLKKNLKKTKNRSFNR